MKKVNSQVACLDGQVTVEEKIAPPDGLPHDDVEKHSIPWSVADGHRSASVFLPAAGYRWNSELNNAGSNGNYWSRTLNSSNPNNAYNLNFNSGNVNWNNNWNNRNNGQSVRAVRVSQHLPIEKI